MWIELELEVTRLHFIEKCQQCAAGCRRFVSAFAETQAVLSLRSESYVRRGVEEVSLPTIGTWGVMLRGDKTRFAEEQHASQAARIKDATPRRTHGCAQRSRNLIATNTDNGNAVAVGKTMRDQRGMCSSCEFRLCLLSRQGSAWLAPPQRSSES